MKINALQQYFLKSENNLRIAAVVADAWPEARSKIVSGFLNRLDARIKKKLKGWESCVWDGIFFVDAYPGFYFWKRGWRTISVTFAPKTPATRRN